MEYPSSIRPNRLASSGIQGFEVATAKVLVSTEAQSNSERMAYKCFISYAVEFLYGSGSKSNGPISPTWNPSTRGLRYVWPRTFWDPDPAPRSPRIQGPVTDAKFMDSRLHSRYRSSGVYIHHPRGNFIANCQLGPFPGPSSRRSRVQDQLLGTARVQRLSGQGEHSSQLPAPVK